MKLIKFGFKNYWLRFIYRSGGSSKLYGSRFDYRVYSSVNKESTKNNDGSIHDKNTDKSTGISTDNDNGGGYKFETLAIHCGQDPDPKTGAVIPTISMATTYKMDAVGAHHGYEYSRAGNPNREQFETTIAALEKARYGLAFSSGSAVTASIVNTLPTGSHILSVDDVYGGTFRYFTKVASTKGISVDFVDLSDPENLRSKVKPETKLVWIESPTNPTLRLVDIEKVAQIAHEYNLLLVVDNTFLSPYFQNPLTLGADVVVHSVTKYINGHSDVVMGVAVTNNEQFYGDLKFQQNCIGAVPSPFDCFLASRGVKTLALRMKAHMSNAIKVAEYLSTSPYVIKVMFPGLPSHPQHKLALHQQRGFSGMISFQIKGDGSTAEEFLKNTKLFALAESLGGVESLIGYPCKMTHAALTPEAREALGITDTLIRVSVGIEDANDLIADLDHAFKTSCD